jgi:DnaD/phage-associated family protein
MAKYRAVHTTFWDDAFVLDLTPEEKYFYLYLMTNDKTTQCGIYELPKRVMEMQTGYHRETIDKLLKRFMEYKKVDYNDSTKEVMMINWAKYNFINSPKVKKCIQKELESIKHTPFKDLYLSNLIQYGYRIDTVSIDYGEKEKEKEKQKEKQKEKETVGDAVNPYDFYQQNFGVLNSFVAEDIGSWVDETNEILVVEAMKIALQNQKPWRYATGILKDWYNHNIKTLHDIQAHEKKFKAKQEKQEQSKPHTKEMEGIF